MSYNYDKWEEEFLQEVQGKKQESAYPYEQWEQEFEEVEAERTQRESWPTSILTRMGQAFGSSVRSSMEADPKLRDRLGVGTEPQEVGGYLQGLRERSAAMQDPEYAQKRKEAVEEQVTQRVENLPTTVSPRPDREGIVGNVVDFADDFATALAGSAFGMGTTAAFGPVGSAVFFEQFYNDKDIELQKNGVDEDTRHKASLIRATLGTLTEQAGNILQFKAIGNVFSKGGNKVVDVVGKKLGKEIPEKLQRYMGSVMMGAAAEGFEEYADAYADLAATVYAENPDASNAELMGNFIDQALDAGFQIDALYGGAVGAAVGAFYPAGGVAIDAAFRKDTPTKESVDPETEVDSKQVQKPADNQLDFTVGLGVGEEVSVQDNPDAFANGMTQKDTNEALNKVYDEKAKEQLREEAAQAKARDDAERQKYIEREMAAYQRAQNEQQFQREHEHAKMLAAADRDRTDAFIQLTSTRQGVLGAAQSVINKLNTTQNVKEYRPIIKTLQEAHKALSTGEDNVKKLENINYEVGQIVQGATEGSIGTNPRMQILAQKLQDNLQNRIVAVETKKRMEIEQKDAQKTTARVEKEVQEVQSRRSGKEINPAAKANRAESRFMQRNKPETVNTGIPKTPTPNTPIVSPSKTDTEARVSQEKVIKKPEPKPIEVLKEKSKAVFDDKQRKQLKDVARLQKGPVDTSKKIKSAKESATVLTKGLMKTGTSKSTTNSAVQSAAVFLKGTPGQSKIQRKADIKDIGRTLSGIPDSVKAGFKDIDPSNHEQVENVKRVMLERIKQSDEFTPFKKKTLSKRVEQLTTDIRQRAKNGVTRFSKNSTPSNITANSNVAKTLTNIQKTASSKAMNIKVVDTVDQMPESVRKNIGENENVEAVYDPDSKTIYFASKNIASPKRAVEVWLHEQVVHHGVREVLNKSGKDFNKVLDDASKILFSGKRGKAVYDSIKTDYTSDIEGMSEQEQRRFIAEEAIAKRAEKLNPTKKKAVFKRILDFINNWIRKIVGPLSSKNAQFTMKDLDVLLEKSKKYVMRGSKYTAEVSQEKGPAKLSKKKLWDFDIKQEFKSAPTSINAKKAPAFVKWFANRKDMGWVKGSVNVDIGGGRHDKVIEALAEHGVENRIIDPFNRSKEYNQENLDKTKMEGGADTATASNVLNVIKEKENRNTVIRQLHDILKPDGTAIISIYEGNKSGKGAPTQKGESWQNNLKAVEYLDEVKAVFPEAKVVGSFIIAKKETGNATRYSKSPAHKDYRTVWHKFTSNTADYLRVIQQLESGSIKDHMSGYKNLRLLSSLGSVMGTVIHEGAPIYNPDTHWVKVERDGTGGLLSVFDGMSSEDYKSAQHRLVAESILELVKKKEGDPKLVSRLFGKDENGNWIDPTEGAHKILADTKEWADNNKDAYQKIKKHLSVYNKAMLDFAEHSGIISPESRKGNKEAGIPGWEREIYLPLNRVFESFEGDETYQSMVAHGKEGTVGGIKRIKGSEKAIDFDNAVQNLILNYSYLMNESLKNISYKKVFGSLKDTAMITQQKVNAAMAKKLDNIITIRVKGKEQYFQVEDTEVFQALSDANNLAITGAFSNFLSGTLEKSKRWLTKGVTISPAFRVRNFLRDTHHTWVLMGDANYFKHVAGAAKGFMDVLKDHPDMVELRSQGGAFTGDYYGAESKSGMERIVKAKVGGKHPLKKLLSAWEKIGEAAENANRLVLYRNAKAEGKSTLEAAYQAKDILDFSMRGKSKGIQMLTRYIPFLNARIQGLYRMARATGPERRGMLMRSIAFKGAALMAFSLALHAFNEDEPEYQELTDTDRWNYTHFFIGGKHFTLPNPFEVGTIFMAAPVQIFRSLKTWNKKGSKELYDFIMHSFRHTFAVDPLGNPLLKEFVGQTSGEGGWDSFYKMPIVPAKLQRRDPEYQWDHRSSKLSRALGKATGSSPKRIDHAVKGLFAFAGQAAVTIIDNVFLRGYGEEQYGKDPALTVSDQYWLPSALMRHKVPRYTRYEQIFYDLLLEADTAMNTFNNLKKYDTTEAKQYRKENKQRVKMSSRLNKLNLKLRKLYTAEEKARKRKQLTPEEKLERIDKLTQRRHDIIKKELERIGEI
jgi:hypothetical protein